MNKKNRKLHETDRKINLSQYRRLLRIHQTLANRNFPNANELAEILSVHKRKVRRDLAFMRDTLNAPIVFNYQKKGFQYTHTNWEMPLIPLTEGELLAFFIATIAQQGKGNTYEDERLRRAIAKIANSLPEEISVSLGYLFETTSFQAPPHVIADSTMLDKLHRAIHERNQIEFEYYSPHTGETKTRQVNPPLLHNHEGTWYIIFSTHVEMNRMHENSTTRLKVENCFFL